VASSAEASAKTVEAAIAAAAAKLGLREDQIDVEVLKQAVPSTFGKVGEPALVRVTRKELAEVPAGGVGTPDATAAPSLPPPQPEETAPPEPSSPGVDAQVARDSRRDSGQPRRHPEVTDPAAIAADTELAADFIEGLLDALDVDGDITTWVDKAGGHVDIEGPKLEFMVGQEGETLAALQELTRLAVLRQTQRWVRITIDVNGFKAQRREELAALAKSTAERVAQSRQSEEFEPMTAFERKIVHDVVAAVEGAISESLGEEPNRRVIVRPAAEAS
jgi:spoIIIJ-associated protein